MIDMGTLAGALGSAQAAGTIIKSLVGLKNVADVNSKAIELQAVIIALQSDIGNAIASQAILAQENQQLKNKLAEIEDFRSEAKRYKLFDPWGGGLVYALKESMSNGEPPHYLCANCYRNHQKSILYGAPGKGTPWEHYQCAACPMSIPTHTMEPGLKAEFPPE